MTPVIDASGDIVNVGERVVDGLCDGVSDLEALWVLETTVRV